ncbi:MAG: D-tyrosyl-tRNA(Tyr) deacylase [Candidatus Competibacteraceae bacterium]|nr:D-tyrosyl-tRNA(Tyr) deacylase [Candidatus Competibacteraceae bacterium]
MIGLLQRVLQAQVEVAGEQIAAIDAGLLVLIGVERNDSPQQADRLLERILNYRVFADQDGKMNLSLRDTGGGLLLVPQFTLPADTRKGNRPSFTPAAAPAQGEQLFRYIAQQARMQHTPLATGRFGADMQVSLINDGPVTFWLQVAP